MRSHEPDLAVYVGPTGVGLDLGFVDPVLFRVMFLPPIARGDLVDLPVNVRSILIVDGYFGSHPSVGHLELLSVLKRCRVFGCSSIGAVRAYELRYDGMIGLGRVYQSFFEFNDFMDDEVALLHAPGPYYWPLSLPLVNVRFALQKLRERGLCPPRVADATIQRLKDQYFGHRTLEAVLGAAADAKGPVFREQLRRMISDSDMKRDDYEMALAHVLGITSTKTGVQNA
jgi:hypothetical protein